MSIKRIVLQRFRNYAYQKVEVSGRSIRVSGPNGSGKTNLLEAISCLDTPRGLRSVPFAEMMSKDSTDCTLFFELEDGQTIAIEVQEGKRRQIRINDRAVRGYPQIAQHLRVFWVNALNDRLFMDTPEKRRNLMNTMCTWIDPSYADLLKQYTHTVQERSQLLKSDSYDPKWLDQLEAQLVEDGLKIHAARTHMITLIQNMRWSVFPPFVYELTYNFDPDNLLAGIVQGRTIDRAIGGCKWGAHKSDLHATLHGDSIRLCSNAYQCLAVIGVYLALIRAIGRGPILFLVDEVLSHLDTNNLALFRSELATFPDVQLWFTAIGDSFSVHDGM